MAKIMIVDDSFLARRHIRAAIESGTKHSVVAEAVDGMDACNKYRETLPDFVTMDVAMPVMSGIEAVRDIRKEFPGAHILMVSSVNEKHMILEALEKGACGFILKPLTPEKILEVIKRELGDGDEAAAVASADVVTDKPVELAKEK